MTTKRRLKEKIEELERTNDTISNANVLLMEKNNALFAKNTELEGDIARICEIAAKINDRVKNNSIKAIKEILKKYKG